MRAIVLTRYGGPRALRPREVDRPVPAADEVLLRVHAAAVNAADWRLMRGTPLPMRIKTGLWRPNIRILGGDVAGVVEAVGADVTRHAPGEALFGYISFEAGLGGFAEYVAVPQAHLVHKPANIPFAGAAAVPLATLTAMQGLRHFGEIEAGQRVLVDGASGGVGTSAVQVALAQGAIVSAACSTRNVEQARALGAHHVIDYKREDFATGEARYDLILSANGRRRLSDYARVLAPDGAFVMAGGSMRQLFSVMRHGAALSSPGGQRFGHMGGAKVNQEDLFTIKGWLEAGQLRPVIERTYPLERVPEAVGYVAKGHARGKQVIVIVPEAA